ncbi:hypothetical protein EDB83DRAFT_1856559 [Lactarius deliciosus]|nr:hypothetical protein EDB83DRAFT_1856559 [Lactarius deliciosus]
MLQSCCPDVFMRHRLTDQHVAKLKDPAPGKCSCIIAILSFILILIPLFEKWEHEGVDWARTRGSFLPDSQRTTLSFEDRLLCIDPLAVFDLYFGLSGPSLPALIQKLIISPLPRPSISSRMHHFSYRVTAFASYRAGVLGSTIKRINDFI